jgi:Tol biopolymer transport system component
MSLAAGTRVGSYQVLSLLGAGGMGEVYRARDLKLNRDVALKILPDSVSRDPDRLARFRREAQVLAALNHTNIGHIYGFEDSGATSGLILELVEGQTLADRIALGTIDPLEAASISKQIAEALEAAHERGIIHRDLKPANIKIGDDGTVKVLDFGLAKALEPVSAAELQAMDPANSPTMMSPASTQPGLVLGTAAYMSPEQARGKPIDKRADIWAFGVVLWEMLTGRMLFGGMSLTETLAAVIKDEPSLDQLPPATPPALRSLLARCLQRDPKTRLRDIGEARILLSQPLNAAAATASAPAHRRGWLPLALGAIALAALSGAVVWFFKPSAAVPLRRLEVAGPLATATDFALAPDGTRVAFVSAGHLYVRPFATLDVQDLGPVHASAGRLFWSPDSRTIGFAAEGSIITIPAAGGPPFVVCKIPASGTMLSAQWLRNDNILFSVWRDSLYSVASSGGKPAVYLAINPASEIDFHELSALPDGRLIVATHQRKPDGIVGELVDGNRRAVLTSDPTLRGITYVPPGYLLFRRTIRNAGLWGLPFDGGPLDLAKATLIQAGSEGYDVSDEGTLLVKLELRRKLSFVWVDRGGAMSVLPGNPADLSHTALSPDGQRAAYIEGEWTESNLIVRDLATGVDTPLTFNKPDDSQGFAPLTESPAWFPDSHRILYVTGGVEATALMARNADSAGETRQIAKSGVFGIVSPDGRNLIFVEDDRGHGRLQLASLSADGTAGSARPMFQRDADPDILDVALSPNGRLLAYEASQPNRTSSIFLTEFPTGASRWLVAENGKRPRFSPDGTQLYYVKSDADARGEPKALFMSAAVTLDPPVKVGVATELFQQNDTTGPQIGDFEVSPDGKQFLMTMPVESPTNENRVVLIQNWTAAIKR